MPLIERPNIKTLADKLKAQFSTKLLAGRAVAPGGNIDVSAQVIAGAVWELWGVRDAILDEADPATMSCDRLVPWAARRGVYLKPAAKALGYVRLTGAAGTIIPGSLQIVNGASRIYELDPLFAQPATIGSEGTVVVRMRAAVSGTDHNMGPGAVTLASVVSGIDAKATVIGGGMGGGTSVETCEELRARILSLEAGGVLTTNLEWVRQKVGQWPGVTKVYASACCDCCGVPGVSIYPLMEGVYEPYGIPPAEVLEQIDLWLFGDHPGGGYGEAPVGMYGKVGQAKPVKLHIDIPTMQPVPPATTDRLRAALERLLRERGGVGVRLCKSWLVSQIGQYLGDNCVGEIKWSAETAEISISEVWITPQCGILPVLGRLGV